jgi:hypothetical protein
MERHWDNLQRMELGDWLSGDHTIAEIQGVVISITDRKLSDGLIYYSGVLRSGELENAVHFSGGFNFTDNRSLDYRIQIVTDQLGLLHYSNTAAVKVFLTVHSSPKADKSNPKTIVSDVYLRSKVRTPK